jgi:hypothetical protein
VSESSKPPSAALAILNFFRSDPDFGAMIGDLTEEFHERAESFGARAARLWCWKDTFRNAGALTMREIMRTPVRTIVTAFSCVLAINAVTLSYLLYGGAASFNLSRQWRTLLFLQFITPLVLGWVGARLLRGREWALALTYTAASICYVGVGIAVIGLAMSPAAALRLARPLWPLAVWGNGFRQAAFWLGCFLAMLHGRSRGLFKNASKQFFSIALCATIGGVALLGQAATAPQKMSGQWALDVEKSTFGTPLAPGMPAGFKITGQTLKIDPTEREIRLSGDTLYSDSRGPHSAHDNNTLSLDGKATVLGPISLSFRAVDDSAFEILSQLKAPGRNIEEVSRFSISSDGKTLTETKTQTEKGNPDDKAAIKSSVTVLVFRRLPEQ